MFENNYPYKWIAHLYSGAKISQFENGVQHKFTELEKRFEELDYLQITGLPLPVVINLPHGAKPIIFERVRATNDGVNDLMERFYYFGYQHEGKKTFLVVHSATGVLSVEFDDSTTRG